MSSGGRLSDDADRWAAEQREGWFERQRARQRGVYAHEVIAKLAEEAGLPLSGSDPGKLRVSPTIYSNIAPDECQRHGHVFITGAAICRGCGAEMDAIKNGERVRMAPTTRAADALLDDRRMSDLNAGHTTRDENTGLIVPSASASPYIYLTYLCEGQGCKFQTVDEGAAADHAAAHDHALVGVDNRGTARRRLTMRDSKQITVGERRDGMVNVDDRAELQDYAETLRVERDALRATLRFEREERGALSEERDALATTVADQAAELKRLREEHRGRSE